MDSDSSNFKPTFIVSPSSDTSGSSKTKEVIDNSYYNWLIIGGTIVFIVLFCAFMYFFFADTSSPSVTEGLGGFSILNQEKGKLLGQLANYLVTQNYSDTMESI